jgi:hypothetical protein
MIPRQSRPGETGEKPVGEHTPPDIIKHIIEKSTLEKARDFRKSFEKLFGISITITEGVEVETLKLMPTQKRLERWELDARRSEIRDRTSEPLIVLEEPGSGTIYIVDGHHRWYAACEQERKHLKAFYLKASQPFKPKFRQDVRTFRDLEVVG